MKCSLSENMIYVCVSKSYIVSLKDWVRAEYVSETKVCYQFQEWGWYGILRMITLRIWAAQCWVQGDIHICAYHQGKVLHSENILRGMQRNLSQIYLGYRWIWMQLLPAMIVLMYKTWPSILPKLSMIDKDNGCFSITRDPLVFSSNRRHLLSISLAAFPFVQELSVWLLLADQFLLIGCPQTWPIPIGQFLSLPQ